MKPSTRQLELLAMIWENHNKFPYDHFTGHWKRTTDALKRKDLAQHYWDDDQKGYFWQLTEDGRKALGVYDEN